MLNVLISDENLQTRNELKKRLSSDFKIFEADNGLHALELCDKEEINFYIINSDMPFITGNEFFQRFNSLSINPILVYGNNVEELKKKYDFIFALKDDKIELIVKVVEKLKDNFFGESNESRYYKYENLEIDYYQKKLRIDNKEIKLTPKEMDLLIFLTIHEGTIYSRDDLLTKVWGYDFLGDSRTIDTHIKSLRSKLKSYRNLIITIWGKGYKSEKPKLSGMLV